MFAHMGVFCGCWGILIYSPGVIIVLVFSMSRKRGRPGKKAVVRAECLARLKGGAVPAELLREFSPGPVYDAVREYLSFVDGARGILS